LDVDSACIFQLCYSNLRCFSDFSRLGFFNFQSMSYSIRNKITARIHRRWTTFNSVSIDVSEPDVLLLLPSVLFIHGRKSTFIQGVSGFMDLS